MPGMRVGAGSSRRRSFCYWLLPSTQSVDVVFAAPGTTVKDGLVSRPH